MYHSTTVDMYMGSMIKFFLAFKNAENYTDNEQPNCQAPHHWVLLTNSESFKGTLLPNSPSILPNMFENMELNF